MPTLIQRQESAIAQMTESRSSAKRESTHRRAIARQFHKQSVALGYTADQARQQVQDIYDIYRLRVESEE